jgi:tRNA A64-2'-O-ribosylphosphate transferase
MENDGVVFDEYRPIICCTASRRVVGSEMDEGGYIQGAGDDTENWAHGLTPTVFWTNVETLLNTDEADLPSVIEQLVKQHNAEQATSGDSYRVQLTTNISVCPLSSIPSSNTKSECYISFTQSSTPKETWVQSPRHMRVGLGKAKAASRNLRLALPDICDFVSKFMADEAENKQIIVACETGKDFSVGTALAISCYLFDEDGKFRGVPDREVSFTKTVIKSRLGGFMTTFPAANPSRATLQSVNSFLMDWRN